MTNAVKGETPLVLEDGRRFTLLGDHEALILASVAYGAGIAQLLADIQPEMDEGGEPVGEPNYAGLRAMLFGMLNAFHPKVTLREASSILLVELPVVTEAVAAALENALPEKPAAAEDREAGNAPVPRPDGKTSGASGAKPGSTRKASGGRPRKRSS